MEAQIDNSSMPGRATGREVEESLEHGIGGGKAGGVTVKFQISTPESNF